MGVNSLCFLFLFCPFLRPDLYIQDYAQAKPKVGLELDLVGVDGCHSRDVRGIPSHGIEGTMPHLMWLFTSSCVD